jgi:hypothetical protein
VGFWDSRFWLLPLAAVAIGQGWLTIGLFDSERAWDALGDEQPIVAGKHALHLYHGSLGASAFRDDYRALTYDPSFAAGYPKTPWFDGGSKPAELFQYIAGGGYQPSAYKWGLAACVALIPVFLAMSSWSAGLNHGGAFLAALLGCLVFWSDFGRSRLWAGDLDLLLGSCLGLLVCAQLIAYHETPGLGAWLGLLLSSSLLCLVQPLVVLTLAPAFLLYYFGAGSQHRMIWHLGLFLVGAGTVAGNWPWLQEAARFWWIQAEAPDSGPSPPLTLHELLDSIQHSPLFVDDLHRALAITVLTGSVLGLLALKRTLAPRTLGAAIVGYLALALFGNSWEPLQRIEPARFFFAGLLMATIPAAQAVVSGFNQMGKLTGSTLRGSLICLILLGAAGFGLYPHLEPLVRRCVRVEALPRGLPAESRSALASIQKQTTPDARILWEETRDTYAWSPLLPVLTERCFLGGLGPDALIEHAAVKLNHGQLADRSLADWSDAELADFCRRYNIGWIVCRTPTATTRLNNCTLVAGSSVLADGSRFYRLSRQPSYFVVGQGQVLHCDQRALALADVTPVDGHVVLSFHYHPGVFASTDRVKVEKEPQLYDSIPFIRIRVAGPMSRLTLYWQE